MIIATIKKLDGTVLDHSNFESESDAMTWFQPRIDQGIYGQKYISEVVENRQVLVEPAILDEQGIEIEPAIYETTQVLVQPEVMADFIIDFAENVITEEQLTREKIAKGQSARRACQNVLDLVSGFNQDRELTTPQIQQMIQTFASADFALSKGMPKTAKAAIQAIEVDDILVTQEMKDLCLQLLGDF